MCGKNYGQREELRGKEFRVSWKRKMGKFLLFVYRRIRTIWTPKKFISHLFPSSFSTSTFLPHLAAPSRQHFNFHVNAGVSNLLSSLTLRSRLERESFPFYNYSITECFSEKDERKKLDHICRVSLGHFILSLSRSPYSIEY